MEAEGQLGGHAIIQVREERDVDKGSGSEGGENSQTLEIVEPIGFSESLMVSHESEEAREAPRSSA